MKLSSFEENFCGGKFWDLNETWYTEDPDFTPCFQKTVLSWLPSIVFAFLATLELIRSFKLNEKPLRWNFLNVSKAGFTLALALLSIAELVLQGLTDNDDDPKTNIYPVDYLTSVVYFVTFVTSLVLLRISMRHGVKSSRAHFFLYFLLTCCGAITFRSVIMRKVDQTDEFSSENTDNLLIVFTIKYSMIVFMFILNLMADSASDKVKEEDSKPSPRLSASYFSKLVYVWVTPLMWRGYRNPLDPKDLWDLDPKMASSGVVPNFDHKLEKVLEKKNESRDQGKYYNESQVSANLDGKRGTLKLRSHKKSGVSVFPALLKTFGTPFFMGSITKIIYDTLAVFTPQVMKLMINFVGAGNDEEYWKGYFYAFLLLVTTVFQSLILSQYFEKVFVVGMNLRTALISAIYRKSLRMSSAAKKDSSVGEIVNLMSVDAQRFMDLIPYLNMLWSAPLQIALCCVFMYQELGAAIFSGIAVLILTIPINTVVAKVSRKYQLEQMKNKDKRTKLMSEIIGGVKVLKLYGWEPSFIDQVLGIRDNEIKVLKKSAWLMSAVAFVWTSVPFVVALASFATYVFMGDGNILTAEKAFVTLSYLNIMRMPMTILPFLIIGLVQARVSLDRVNKFINNSELDPKSVEHDPNESDPVVVESGTFKWAEDEPEILKNINIRIKKGSLTAIVGTVGAGKSSLISSLLGEMVKTSGRVNVLGSTAYVPQQAWMQNATLKDNVLFGKVYNKRIYERVLKACALSSDIDILPGGDQTEIGEKGINLSGGQKQRVSLARAVYSQAELYLLDDPLSAVDSHVGKHIFEQVIGPNGELAGKTRLLVTHGITYLPKCDHIIVIKDGSVSEQGSYQELMDKKGAFADFLIEYMSEAKEDEIIDDEILHELEEALGKDTIEKQIHHRRDSHPTSISPQMSHQDDHEAKDHLSRQNTTEDKTITKREENKGTTLIEKETVETGSVKLGVYWYYIKNVGLIGASICLTMQLLFQGSSIGTNFWLSVWSDQKLGNASDPEYRDLYLGVYGAFGVVQALSVMILTVALSITTLDASRLMHKSLLDRVMKSPMSFFDTTPVGRIVNRFAKDVDVCDNTLPTNIRQWLNTFANFIGTVILIISIVPFFGVVIVPVSVVFFFVQTIYVSTSRQLKRLESVSRSPIYSHFGETLNGTSTIRAFGLDQQFILHSEKLVDKNHICYYPSIIANRWLAVWLENIGNLITVAAALFAILDTDSVNPSQVGLIVSYALNVTQVLNWLVRMTSDVETNIVAVERIKEYSEIQQEAKWESQVDIKPPPEWPHRGAIKFENYGMRYREGLDLVVKGIDCDIAGGEMVGIVGRTGAGKSSLTVALFRLVEAAQGRILIDDVDISKLGLHDLRTKLTIIPQDPVLFSGTLRINLDPFDHHSDDDIWKILKLAHLYDYVSSLEAGLSHEVSEGGSNLSVGQRQLICLARALLRKTKVLVLDEATAAVDLETDELIQSTIRKEFKGCTVLTIAHRLNTILDYDRVIVMDKGKIAEFDSPQRLIDNKNSIFYGMVKDAGLAN